MMPEPQKPETIETMTDAERGLLLYQQFQMLIQVQQNILAITKILEASKRSCDKVTNELNDDISNKQV